MKTIKNYPNYAITIDGQVWVKTRYDKQGRKAGGRWLKLSLTGSMGYLTAHLCNNGKKTTKLTEQNVRMIIYMYRTKLFSQQVIANAYKVSQAIISAILTKKTWKHIWSN